LAGISKNQAAILDVVKQWETARRAGAFPESLKPQLQDVDREFHLVAVGPGEWDLQPAKPAGSPVRIIGK
jgi:hypothetical protein